MAKQGQRIDDELKEKIRAALVLTENKNEIAKNLNVSWSTVNKVAKEIEEQPEENEKFGKLREEKKEEVITMIWDGFLDGVKLGNQMIRDALEGKRDIPLNHLSTYNGTMYDKHALMTGGNTAKVGIDGEVNHNYEYHIEQTITTDPEAAQLLKQLYKRQQASTA